MVLLFRIIELCYCFSSCDQCVVFLNKRDPSEEETVRYEAHIISRDEAYLSRQLDIEDPSKVVVSFDLQQILPFPKLRSSKQTFYKSRMVLYNLCFFVKNTQQGYCMCWSQVEGGRGSNEIATCLKKFFSTYLADSRHVVFYSDGCPGQNKNRAVVAALVHLAHNSRPGQIVELKFFETGHSHMDVDSVHASIERASEGAEIGTPGDWVQVFQSAKKSGAQYIVDELSFRDFSDWKQVATSAFKSNALKGIASMHCIRAANVGGAVELQWSEGCLGPLRPVDWRCVGGQYSWGEPPRAYLNQLSLDRKNYLDSSSLVPLLRNRSNAELYFRYVCTLVPGTPQAPANDDQAGASGSTL